MKKFKILMVGMLLLFLSGCFQVEYVIKVNKDGSGTIEKTVLLSQELMQMSRNFGGGKFDKNNDESAYHDIQELKKEAVKIGENVKYISSKPMKSDDKVGYHVVYSFSDITKTNINENPAGDMMDFSEKDKEKENMHFKFQKGKTSELTIIFPHDDDDETTEYEEKNKDNSPVSSKDLKMMRGMYKGMKISIKVIVDGKIVNTNATYKDRNVITLSDIDFDVIMENEKALQILAGNENASEEVMKKSMQKFPGFKTDLNDKIVIKFK